MDDKVSKIIHPAVSSLRRIVMTVNCWDYKKCGRGAGGVKSSDLGVCPASTDTRMNGIHGGTNGGRACWIVAGRVFESLRWNS